MKGPSVKADGPFACASYTGKVTVMGAEGKQITLQIQGLGIVFHSPVFAQHIPEGADYLASDYTTENQVQSHIQKGTIVVFGTGTPGTFRLSFHTGYPDEVFLQRVRFKLRLGLHRSDGLVCFKDLYELMDRRAECTGDRIFPLEDGFYHVTLSSEIPQSGILGDDQEIQVYLQKLAEFPKLATQGIPTLCM